METIKLMQDIGMDSGQRVDIGLRDCHGNPVHWLDVVRVYHRSDGVYDMLVLYNEAEAAFAFNTWDVKAIANPPGWEYEHDKTASRGFLINTMEPIRELVKHREMKWCRFEVIGHVNRVFQVDEAAHHSWQIKYQFGGREHTSTAGFQIPQAALGYAFSRISEAHKLEPKIMEGAYYEQAAD